MLKTCKRPVATVLALLMCLALLSGIVLPEVAETANAVTDPYARINATDAGGGVWTPGANVYFVNNAWASSAPAADGATFDYLYGNNASATIWGNGKTYRLTYNVNAFPSWMLAVRTLRHLDPATANNAVVVFAPGWVGTTAPADSDDGVASSDTNATNAMTAPADPTTAEEADYMNVWLLGPQAGKNPVTEKGSVAVANDRSRTTSREFVFTANVWMPKNGVYHMDGFAANQNFRFLCDNTASGGYATGLHVVNMYVDMNTAKSERPFLSIGGGNTTNVVLSVTTIKDSYFWNSTQDSKTAMNVVQSNYVLIDNCVFRNFNKAATDAYNQNSHILFGPAAYSAASATGAGSYSAFLGDYQAKYCGNVTNCTFYDWTSAHALRLNYNRYTSYGTNGSDAEFNIDGNVFTFSGSEEDNGGAGDFIDLDKVATGTACAAKLNVTNNDFMLSSVNLAAGRNRRVIQGNSGYNIPITFRGNIVRGDFTATSAGGVYLAQTFASFATTTDVSGNLFVDYDGTVHTPHASTTGGARGASQYFVVKTDVYASDEMAGGIAELFTVQETKGDLFVTNCKVVTINRCSEASEAIETDGLIKASVVVLPEDGKTYSTEDLFIYNNSKVEFLGVFSDAACTTPAATLSKGFGTLYAKARYATANTTCTVRYTITEPTVFRVVDLSDVGTYTFNGDTFADTARDTAGSGTLNGESSANVEFYSTLAKAYAAVSKPTPFLNDPMDEVILLMPGTGHMTGMGTGFNKSVALIGPKFGVNPRAIGSFDVQNGRSYTDTTNEAVMNGQMQIAFPDKVKSENVQYVYFAAAGLSYNTTRALRIDNNTLYTKVNNSNNAANNGGDTDIMLFINAQDLYNHPTSASGSFLYDDSVTTNLNNRFSSYVYINRCLTDDSGVSHTTGSRVIQDGGFSSLKVHNFTAANFGSRICYWYPTNPGVLKCRPANAVVSFKNSNFGQPTVGSDNVITIVGSTAKNTATVDTSLYGDGIDVIFVGNRFGNTTLHTIKIHPDQDNVFGINIVGNTFNCGTNGTGASVFSTSYYRADNQTSRATLLRYANVTDNVVIGKSPSEKTFRFSDNDDPARVSVNVDDNAYLRVSDGERVAVAPQMVGATTPAYAWMDSAHTYKNSDFALATGGFTSVTQGGDFFSWNATGIGSRDDSDIAFADTGVTLLGIFDDFDCTTPVESFDPGDTVYIRAKKGTVVSVQKLTYTSPWAEIGLAPANEGEPVVVPTDGTVMFVSPTATDFSDVLCDSTGAPTGGSLSAGDDFYIKMPTTGIVYKLKYGTNANKIDAANLRNHPTVVFCPGNYSTGTAYNAAGHYAVGRPNNGTLGTYHDWKFVGPYFGVPASNGESDALINDRSLNGTYEAYISYNASIYLMNDIISEGGSFTIDGMNLSGGIILDSKAGENADNTAKYNYHWSVNLKNVVLGNLANKTFFLLYAYGGSGGSNTDSTRNYMKSILTLNIDNCHCTWPTGAVGKGMLNADFVNIRHTAWLDLDRTDNDAAGLYINPTKAANYENTEHKPTYLAENNYISIARGTLFTFGMSNASADVSSSTRAGMDIIFRDNKIIDSCISRGNAIRSALATTYATAAQGGIISWIFTGNTVTNTTGSDPLYGALLCSQTNGAAKAVDISDNVITGYPRPFDGITNATYENNVFFGLDGETPYVIQPRHGAALTDVALTDLDHHASDFNVTQVAGSAAGAASVSWNVNAAFVGKEKTWVSINDAPTAADPKLTFSGSNVAIEGVYTDAACTTPAVGALTAGERYYVKAVYNDGNDAFVVVDLFVDRDFGATPVYSGDRYWLLQSVEGMPDGMHVAEQVLEGAPGSYTKTTYVFTVGENVFADPDDVPTVSNVDRTRNIYLFPVDYTLGIGAGNADDRGTMFNFYGAKHGVNPVTLDGSGIPTSTRNAARTTDSEESIISRGIALGYQAQATVDGVAFGGDQTANYGQRVYETSAAYDGISYVSYTVTNCISVNSGSYNTASSYGPLSFKGDINKEITATNNHIVADATQVGHDLLVVRNAQSLDVSENYVWDGNNASRVFVWYSTTRYTNTASGVSGEDVEIDIDHNFANGTVCIDNLAYAASVDLSVANNRLTHNDTDNWLKQFRIWNPETSRANTNFADISIDFSNNILAPASTVLNKYVGFQLDATGTNNYGSVTVSGNTFDNTSGNYYAAFWNLSQTPVTLSGNTFVNFKHNYASRANSAYYAGGSVSVNYAENELTTQNVTIASDNTFNGRAANYIDGTDTLGAHMGAGDSGVDDAAHEAVDICGDDWYYFEPVGNMMVKTTADDGTVYYNVFPVGTDNTFKAQLCAVDGTVTGSEYTVTTVDDILSVSASPTTSVVQDMTGEVGFNAAKPYAVLFVGNIATTAAFETVTGAVDMKVLDYGMYYANAADAFDDFTLYEDNALVVDGKTVAVKRTCAANAEGLGSVYQNYSFRFKFIAPGLYRYGKMYVTYSVGETVRTVYSSTITLHTPAGS